MVLHALVPLLAGDMRAAYVDRYAPNLTAVKVSTLPYPPQPALGEIKVAITASSVNPIDWKTLDGSLKDIFPFSFPHVVGCDVVGRVIGCGGAACNSHAIGARVWANLGVAAGGAWAEEIVLPEESVSRAPATGTDEGLASLPVVGMTMLQAFDFAQTVFTTPHRQMNHSVVVIPSGAGGTGTAGIQIARALGASHVASTAGSSEDAALLRKLGASTVFDYHSQPLLDEVADDSVDVWIENYGYHPDRALAKVRAGGAYVSLVHALPSAKKAGVFITALSCNHSRVDTLHRLAQLVEAQQVLPVVMQSYPMSRANAALEHSRSSHVLGKIAMLGF